MDEIVDNIVRPVSDVINRLVFFEIPIFGTQVPFVVLWLFSAALFFTVYFNFLNFTGIKHAIKLIKGDFDKKEDTGEINHFQALCTALSGTVGIGNIGGMAIVISLGGPGAVFWLFISGFLGMASKFAECVLGIKYRVVHDDGSVSGGPMYYLSRGFSDLGWSKLGRFLGTFYAIAMVFGCLGIGNMFQSNQAYEQFLVLTGGTSSFVHEKGWLFGTALAILVGLVIIGGVKRIAQVTSRIVPFMAIGYVVLSLAIIFINADKLPWAIQLIFTEAFSPRGVSGGMLAVMVWGIKRAVFSNEAGIGSAAIAHSAVKTDEPVSEGYVGFIEPLIDTVVICTITSLVILTTVYDPTSTFEIHGIALTSKAFESTFSWSVLPLSFIAVLFAFSTMISWAYYGLKGWSYLFGISTLSNNIFNIIFCVFIAIGCMVQLSAVLDFSDAIIFLVAFPNILGLYFLAPIIKRELKSYQSRVVNRK